MRVLIYGAGAVGLGMASCLIKTGVDVDMIARLLTKESLQQHGLVRKGIFGETFAPYDIFRCFTSLAELEPMPYDFILVCTKSFDTKTASLDFKPYPDLRGPHTRIVLFQNGWGNADIFCQSFASRCIYNARVITGFDRDLPFQVNVTVHAAPIHIGSLFGHPGEDVQALALAISKGDIPCRVSETMEADLWAKMLFNCTLNPLGALLNVPYGELAAQSSTRELMNKIVAEIFHICTAAGYHLYWQCPDDFLRDFYGQQVPATARHRSSMLQDIQAGKRTEIDALNGAVIALSMQYGIDIPYNRAVYNLVKFIEGH